MGTDSVRGELSVTVEKLTKSADITREFLNSVTLQMLVDECGDDVRRSELSLVLDQLRRLLVYSDEAIEACKMLLTRKTLNAEHARKRMAWVYHHCVEEFFQPRFDTWYEDSRAAYSGIRAVTFRTAVPSRLKTMMALCEEPVQQLREELEYYGDFRAHSR
ncbi:hypothetical protein CR205_07815 [Alteribacter lacisalsi]|jgi:hypothetical protein|uniref:Uncharacterized protein n=1 Tax=Alteribacter lacisalsi TaxID=2045244 RepID=A0A2W0HLR0_9BACI|nr:DUF3907 family protein [Alteribacter lacisalsi]PYZ98485.1 hypothetical protein CR205_07815 [Alteribacter lacisalsi]